MRLCRSDRHVCILASNSKYKLDRSSPIEPYFILSLFLTVLAELTRDHGIELYIEKGYSGRTVSLQHK